MRWNAEVEAARRRRFVDDGLKNRPPVLAVPAIFFAMWITGWASSAILLALGMTSIPARHAIGCLLSYGVFVFLVGVWCRYAIARRTPDPSARSPFDGIDLVIPDGEGCMVVLGVALIGILISGVFWLVGGYALLFEVAFEVAFAGTMVYRMNRRYTLGDWAGTLIRRTWLPAIVVSGLLVAVGAKLQHDHPGAATVPQALKAYRSSPK